MFSSRVTPDSYHSTLSLCDNLTVCFHLGQHNSSAYTTSLLHSHINFRYLHGSLTPTLKFRKTPRVSYTHIEIRDTSPSLLHPHRNLGYLPGSLTPTQKFRIPPRVSYTHTEIWDISPSLLHPHRNLGYLPGSLTPTQKFGISPRVSYTHTGPFGYYRGSPSPKLQASHLRGLTTPYLLFPTRFNYSSFLDSNYESSLDVVPKTNSTHTHQEWGMTIPCTHTLLEAMLPCS